MNTGICFYKKEFVFQRICFSCWRYWIFKI